MALGVLVFPGAFLGVIGLGLFPVLLPAIPLVAVGGAALPLILRRRPSDVEIDRDGLEFVGGRTDGYLGGKVSWGDVNIAEWQFSEQTRRRFGPQPLFPTTKLLANDGEDALVLAETSSDEEVESLHGLVHTLEAMSSDEAAEVSDEVVRCTFCGAPVVPDATSPVRCASCDTKVELPQEVCDRIAAQRELRGVAAQESRSLRALLKQPSAKTTNTLLLVLGVVLYAVWIGCVPLAFEMWVWQALDADVVPWLVAFPIGLLVCCYAVAMGLVRRRYALRAVLLDYGATGPSQPGAPHLCRACSAPLPDARDEMVVRCAYCNAENVLGLDLRGKARGSADESSLRRDLAYFRSSRAFWAMLAILAVAPTVWLTRGFVTHVSDAFHHAPPVRRR